MSSSFPFFFVPTFFFFFASAKPFVCSLLDNCVYPDETFRAFILLSYKDYSGTIYTRLGLLSFHATLIKVFLWQILDKNNNASLLSIKEKTAPPQHPSLSQVLAHFLQHWPGNTDALFIVNYSSLSLYGCVKNKDTSDWFYWHVNYNKQSFI